MKLGIVGLQETTYYIDSFILKTIIYNDSTKNPIIENENSTTQVDNPIFAKEERSIEIMQHALEQKSYNLACK